jgi:hypothetical protein
MRCTRSPLALLIVSLGPCAMGCGGGSGDPDAATSSRDAWSASDAPSTSSDAPSLLDSPSASDAPTAGETTYEMGNDECFTFATATAMPSMSMTCGDMQGLTGINVDISAPGDGLCLLPGTYTTLASIPTDYASCFFSPYVEGADPLADRAMIVADAAGAHHYRVHIVSNLNPTLVFSFDMID